MYRNEGTCGTSLRSEVIQGCHNCFLTNRCKRDDLFDII